MKNKKERKEKTCIILHFRKKNEPRSQEFFLGKRPGDEVAEKH